MAIQTDYLDCLNRMSNQQIFDTIVDIYNIIHRDKKCKDSNKKLTDEQIQAMHYDVCMLETHLWGKGIRIQYEQNSH